MLKKKLHTAQTSGITFLGLDAESPKAVPRMVKAVR